MKRAGLRGYLIRRLIYAGLIAWGVVTITFILLRLGPSSPADRYLANMSARVQDPAQVTAAIEARYGLDRPVWQQYADYVTNLVRGDWGWSFSTSLPVIELIKRHWVYSFQLILLSMLFAASLGILIASRMRSQQGFHVVVQLIIFPLIFLSGVFFPVNNVPMWLQVVSKINPLTYGVDAIRQLFLGSEAGTAVTGDGGYAIGVTIFGHTMSILEDLIVVAVLGVVLMLASVWSFNRQE